MRKRENKLTKMLRPVVLTLAGFSIYQQSLEAKEIKLPNGKSVDTEENITQKTPHFKWKEATKNGTRIPPSTQIVRNIKETAEYMEQVRKYLGNNPIKINSWYRPPEVNSHTKGASRKSQHMLGKAVDFRVKGISPAEVYRRLDSWHGAKGGLGKYQTFTHIDIRKTKARWER